MAPSGNLELGVTINGKRAVAEAKVQGEAAGAAYQSGFNNAFDEGLSKIGSDVFADLRKRGAFEGDYVGDAFASKFRSRLTSAADDIANAFSFKGGLDDFAKDFDNVDEAAVHLRQSLTLLNDEGKIGESAFRRYGGSLNNWLGSARKTEVESDRVRAGMDDIGHALDREVVNFERVAQAFDLHNKKGTEVERVTRRLEPALKSAGNGFNGFHSNLLSLSNNFGQVVAIIGLILSSLPELAVLSSAAGGGVLILADALGALVFGAGVFAGALFGLLGDIKNVPVAARPAAEALRGLLKPLQDLQKQLEVSVFAGLQTQIAQIGTILVPQLSGSLNALGRAVNSSLGNVLSSLLNPTAIDKFNTFISGTAPIFERLVNSAIKFGDAIGTVLIAGLPAATRFAAALDGLAGRFDNFVNSARGKDALASFFSDAEDVLGHVGKLIDGVSKLISSFITPQAVKGLGDFLDSLTTGLLPLLSSLVTAFDNLDVVGLVGDIFRVLGPAIASVLDVLGPFLNFIGVAVQNALPGLAAILDVVTLALQPLSFGFDFLNQVIAALQPYIDSVSNSINQVFDVMVAAGQEIWTDLQPAIADLIQSFIGLLPSPQQFAAVMQDQVIPAIQGVVTWIEANLVPALESVIEWVADVINGFGGFEGLVIEVQIWTTKIASFFQIMADAIHFNIAGIISDSQKAQDKLAGLASNLAGVRARAAKNGTDGFGFAAGGILYGRTQVGPGIVAGEAGPEAFVPLGLPPSQVDPSVRLLAAIAQGRLPIDGGGGKSVSIGQVQVITPATNGEIIAEQVVDAIAEQAAS